MLMTVSDEHQSLHREEPGGNNPKFGADFAVFCPVPGLGVCPCTPSSPALFAPFHPLSTEREK